MQVRILGPMELIKGGVVATPTAPKLRHVLALLSLRTNSVVSTEQFIEELWDDRPPLSAMTTLQTYIYQLRKLLNLNGSGVGITCETIDAAIALRTCPGGYTLHMPQLSVDANLFEDLTERGRNELAMGDIERAAQTLQSALCLWRAPALVDVKTGPVLSAAAVRLVELHKSVLEQRIDIDIQLGKHQELTSELSGLVASHPTHEGFQAKLMLVLHRAGRRSEALATYQRARFVLADELGLEPSQELQRMHSAVLAADPAIDPPSGVKSVVSVRRRPVLPPPLPKQLPPDVPAFVGRGPELAKVHKALTTGTNRTAAALVVVVGQPGSGKSGFCVHAAHDVAAAFPDGQFFSQMTNATGEPLPPAAVLADFLVAAGFVRAELPEGLPERAALFRTWTVGRKVLVVLDDVINYEQVVSLLPSEPASATVLASRRRLIAPSISLTCEMPPLSRDDAQHLLLSMMDAYRVEREPDATHTLLQVCAGSPLTVRAVATWLATRPHWPLSRFVDRLNNDRFILEELNLISSTARSFSMLPEASQAAFEVLALLPRQPISVETAAVLLGVDAYSAENTLENLVEFQLAEVADCHASDKHGFRYCFRSLERMAARAIHRSRTTS